jgi:Holliday junction resolvase RusA-like endonuclease
MYRPNGRGGRILTDEAMSFRERAGWEAKAAVTDQGWHYPPGARLALTMRLTFGSRRKADLDNRCKAALDAIAPVLGFDDSVIDRLVIERAGMVPGCPACVIVLEIV